MKQLRRILEKIIYPTCTLTVLIASLFMLVLFTTETTYERPGMTPSGFLLILLWSFFFVCTCLIFRLKISIGFRVLIHFAACTLTFVVCFILLGGYYADHGATSLLITLVFALAYFLICIPILLVRRHLIQKQNGEQTYRSLLTKTKQ